MKDRLRRLLPPAGLPYALFDSAVFVGVLVTLWYVATPVSEATTAALSDSWAQVVSPRRWGWLLLMASAFAAACSYGSHRALRTGYVVLAAACGLWSSILLIGAAIAVDTPADPRLKAAGVALVFGYTVRRLLAEAFLAEELSGAGRSD